MTSYYCATPKSRCINPNTLWNCADFQERKFHNFTKGRNLQSSVLNRVDSSSPFYLQDLIVEALHLLDHIFLDFKNEFGMPASSLMPAICRLRVQITVGGQAEPMLESRRNVSSTAESRDFSLLCFPRFHVKLILNNQCSSLCL